MALLGKRPTMLLALMLIAAALACAAVLLTAGFTPANAQTTACDFDPATPDPLCLVIRNVSPEPGATNVPLAPVKVFAKFNQEISIEQLSWKIRLINVGTGENVTGSISYQSDRNILGVIGTNTGGSFECGTTYMVIVGGNTPRRAVQTESGLSISKVPAGVELSRHGVARWTFTTEACT